MRNLVSLVVLMTGTVTAFALFAALPACNLLGLGGGGPDGGTPDAGPQLNGGKLTACSCDALDPVNNTKPICGCTPGSVGTGPSLGDASYTSAVVDGAGDRLLVGVAGTGGSATAGGALWAVDLKTGNRTVVSGSQAGGAAVGAGDDMVDVDDVDSSSSGAVLAFEHHASDTIVNQVQSIDATSGDRTTILTSAQMVDTPLSCTTTATVAVDLGNINPATGFAVGSDDTLYFGVHLETNYAAVVAVTTGATPSCKVLSADDGSDDTDAVGTGDLLQDVSSLTFAQGSLWAYDFVTNAMFKIDPSTGARKIVSEPSADAPVGDDADPENTCFPSEVETNVFAIGSGTAFAPGGEPSVVLTKIDLANGKRSCIGGTPSNATNEPVIDSSNVDSSAGVYLAPNGVVIALGANVIWEIDADVAIANVLSE